MSLLLEYDVGLLVVEMGLGYWAGDRVDQLGAVDVIRRNLGGRFAQGPAHGERQGGDV